MTPPSRPQHGVSRRRLLGTGLAATTLTVLPAARAAAPGAAAPTTGATLLLFQRINEVRAAHGLVTFGLDHRLGEVAQAWSVRMAAEGQVMHNEQRMAQYGFPVAADSEVVGWARAAGSSASPLVDRLVEEWLASPPHAAIVLGDFTDIGVGWARSDDDTAYATVDLIRTPLPAAAQEALGLSREIVADGAAARVVLARSDVFADALAGSGLLSPTAPLLLTLPDQPLPAAVLDEIVRVLPGAGTAYLLGGALSGAIISQLEQAGIAPRRLQGLTRFETAVVVAREVVALRGQPARILIARGDDWADAAAVGAVAAWTGQPVVLTERHRLHPVTAAFLAEHPAASRVVLGGRAVLEDSVRQAAGAWRVGGADRASTSADVARVMWGREVGSADDAYLAVPGWTPDGWAAALCHASYAAANEAAVLYLGDTVPPGVRQLMTAAGYGPAMPAMVRFSRGVGDTARAEMLALAGG